jgi:hypothetical protein
MFWVYDQTRTTWKTILVLLIIASTAGIVAGKCPNAVIRLYGEIEGEVAPNLKITLEICPSPRRTLPVVPVSSSNFEIEAYFDTYILEDEHGKEFCGRMPESIALVLKAGDKEVDRVKVDFNDFVRDEKGHFALRKGVRLRNPGAGAK